MSLREVVQAFSRSHHRGFPVVQNGQLVGIVSQSDLSDISEVSGNHPSSERQLAEIMTPNPVTVSPKDQLPQVLYLLNRFKLSRLPVVEDQRLVGIITRADIIRAESDHLSGQVDQLGPQPEPSYVVYQTRSPVTGKGRILVPLANPKTAPILLEMAAAIARQRQYEIECLQIIEVSRRYAPAATPVDTTASRNLLTEAELLCEQWNIAVHTQIRVAHDIAHTVLDVIKDRHIDLTLMGWKGGTATPERVFGNVVDTIIRQATCEVVLIRLGEAMNFNRWLIPVAGGPNALQAVQLVPALATIGHNTEVVVCQVFPPDQKMTQRTEGMIRAIQVLRPAIDSRIMPLCLVGTSVADTLLQVARRYQTDVILMGATRDSLLQQVIQGNIPEAVARRSHCTVILVRSADTGLVQQNGSA
jgi:CIC family chloride channel protein